MKTYSKLVRDRIPEIIESTGKTCKINILSDEEYKNKLSEKLVEEAKEFQESREIEELADLIEVYNALLKTYNISANDVEVIREKKALERGGFDKKIQLLEVHE